MYHRGDRDIWWTNLSSPGKFVEGVDSIPFTLDDSEIGSICLDVARVKSARTHYYHGIEITTVHVEKENGKGRYFVYFEKKEDNDGYYYP